MMALYVVVGGSLTVMGILSHCRQVFCRRRTRATFIVAAQLPNAASQERTLAALVLIDDIDQDAPVAVPGIENVNAVGGRNVVRGNHHNPMPAAWFTLTFKKLGRAKKP